MIQNIRLNTFETNSSSIHAMIICEGDEQNKLWKEGNLYADSSANLYTLDELKIKFKENYDSIWQDYIKYGPNESDSENVSEDTVFEYWIYDQGYENVDNWYSEYEHDSTTYKTKSGDIIHIECAYGQDY